MSTITDIVNRALQGEPTRSLSERLGATPEQTENALRAAVPTLVQALSNNARKPRGRLRSSHPCAAITTEACWTMWTRTCKGRGRTTGRGSSAMCWATIAMLSSKGLVSSRA